MLFGLHLEFITIQLTPDGPWVSDLTYILDFKLCIYCHEINNALYSAKKI